MFKNNEHSNIRSMNRDGNMTLQKEHNMSYKNVNVKRLMKHLKKYSKE